MLNFSPGSFPMIKSMAAEEETLSSFWLLRPFFFQNISNKTHTHIPVAEFLMRLSVRAGFANAMTPIQPRVAHLSTSAADFKNGQLERLARAATAAAPVREEKRLSPIGNFFLFCFFSSCVSLFCCCCCCCVRTHNTPTLCDSNLTAGQPMENEDVTTARLPSKVSRR